VCYPKVVPRVASNVGSCHACCWIDHHRMLLAAMMSLFTVSCFTRGERSRSTLLLVKFHGHKRPMNWFVLEGKPLDMRGLGAIRCRAKWNTRAPAKPSRFDAGCSRSSYSIQKRDFVSRSELQRGQRLGRLVRVRSSNSKPHATQRGGSTRRHSSPCCRLRRSLSMASGKSFSETPSSRDSSACDFGVEPASACRRACGSVRCASRSDGTASATERRGRRLEVTPEQNLGALCPVPLLDELVIQALGQ
jgi:hypothetical protein